MMCEALKQCQLMFVSCCLLLSPCALWADDKVDRNEPIPLAQFLPSGEVTVEFMKVDVGERAEELADKFAAGVAASNSWFIEYFRKKSRPGKPLPYHPRLGMSESEYEEFLEHGKSLRLVPRGINKIIRINNDSDCITFEPVEWQLPDIESLSIDLGTSELSDGDEKFGRAEWDVKGIGGGMFGSWRGYQWAISPAEDWEAITSVLSGESSKRMEEVSLDLLNTLDTDYVYFYMRRREYVDDELGKLDILFRYKVNGLSEYGNIERGP